MTTTKANAGLAAKFRTLIKPRDIFLHDGKSLRRISIGSGIQTAALAAAFVLVLWSVIATAGLVVALNGDVAQMQRQVAQMENDVAAIRTATVQRAALLERRQTFLARMLSGQADANELAQLLPAAATPENAAARAVTANFDSVDGMQADLIDRANEMARRAYRQRASAVRQFGIEPGRLQTTQGGVGGPYEPVTAEDNVDPRYLQLFTTWRQLDQLEQGMTAIPSAMPLHASSNFTSGYGVRSDPFRGRAAMHAGIDLAGPIGTPIYATADGVVGRSEWNNGGYGNLVEINHGQGIQTRYGHLSQRIAIAGQRIHRGDLIGLMGSTGRSTGSHLHYEVRIDGRAVNPVPFLQAGATFIAARNVQQPVAIGGPVGGSR